MDVFAVTADPCFNYFFSFGVYWGFLLSGFFAVLTLFRT
jgi:hypothetical protein